MTLCTRLPDLPPADGAERVLFQSLTRSDWCHGYDVDDLHAAFQADGIAYTVQLRPGTPEPDGDGDLDPGRELLTPWQRNSFLR